MIFWLIDLASACWTLLSRAIVILTQFTCIYFSYVRVCVWFFCVWYVCCNKIVYYVFGVCFGLSYDL
jgi:hypothetical protein